MSREPLDPLRAELRQAWTALSTEAAWPADAAAAIGERLLAAWSEPQRRYHDLRHLARCVELFQRYRQLAARPIAVAFALWHHDAVYDPRGGDNEARSAALAAAHAQELGLDPTARQLVQQAIMATCHLDAESADGDVALLVDIDLSILGADPDRFAAYERDVRAEYAFVPWERYRSARAEILRRFSAAERIFQHPALHAAFEPAARRNLSRALADLAPH